MCHLQSIRKPGPMRRAGALHVLAVAALMVGCRTGTPPLLPPGCEADTFLVYDWTFDGLSGSTGCQPSVAAIRRYSGINIGPCYPETTIALYYAGAGIVPGFPDPDLLCGASIFFYNTPLLTGAVGTITPLDPARNGCPSVGQGFDAAVQLFDTYRVQPDPACAANATLTGGTWRVIQGGGAGQTVEVEARDVTFEPLDGHTLRLDRMYWRAQLY